MFASARTFLPVVLFLSSSLAIAQTPAVPCQATAEVKAALKDLPTMMEQRTEALRALRDRFPNDLFVHRAYQEAARFDAAGAEALVKEYAALAEKHAGDPMYRFLAVNALVGVRTKEAIPELEKQAEQYPWARMSLLQVYRSPNFRDAAKLRRHLEAFLQACPAALEAYAWGRNIEDAEFAKQLAAKLRPLLAGRTDPEAARHYGALWMLEFRAAPAAEHDALRKQVAEDVKRLRAAAPEKSRDYLPALREGYTLIGDAENAKWAEEQMKAAQPASAGSNAVTAAQRWREKNPYPKPDDPPEKRTAFNQAYLDASAEWVKQWPNEMGAWMSRMSALRMAPRAAAEDVLAAGEAVLRLHPGSNIRMFPPLPLQVAEMYLSKNVGRDRLADLARRAMEEVDKPSAMLTAGRSDLYPAPTMPAGMPDADSRNAQMQFSGWNTIARIWLELADKEKAREAVQRLDSLLQKLRPPEKADPKVPEENMKRMYASQQSTYWERMGRLAELETRKVDALTFYQNAIMARTVPLTQGELIDRARAVWNELGGSNEGWQAWVTRRKELMASASPPAASPPLARPPTPATVGPRWNTMDKPLPEFQVADLRGKKWSLEDFRGKTTFVNFWATW